MKRVVLSLAISALLMALTAVPAGAALQAQPVRAATAATAATRVFVTLGDMFIHTISVVRAGTVTFTVKNTGAATHELVVLRTDLADDQLQPNPDEAGKVEEDGGLGESGDLAPGTTGTFTLTLTPGHYVLICNEPGHYAAGMHTTLTVANYVGVTLQEMSIALQTNSVPAGPTIFDVTNAGTVTHELVVIRTDLAFDKLPANPEEAGKVEEDGSLGESGDITAARSSSFLLTLSPGKYVLICNEPGHYAAGMRIAFTVK
jgi:uncharacterized cupredoxin-like copper-binding protein